MNILIISKLLPHPLGVSGSIIIYNRIRNLVERGHAVSLLSFIRPEEEPYVRDIRDLVSDLQLFPAPEAASAWQRLARLWASTIPSPFREDYAPDFGRLAGEMVERTKANVAVAEFSSMGQYLYRNPHLPAIRRIVSCHKCCTQAYANVIRFHRWSPSGLKKRIGIRSVRRYEFAMYRNMDRILVLTSQQRYILLNYAPNLRVSVVPHGVDIAHYTPAPMADREISLLFVGYFFNESNRDAVHWFARTVWPRLRKSHPAIRFYVVGRGATPALHDLARRDPRIIVTGEVDDVRPYLARARVFVCPMRIGSGFRAKILEAMASGIPVVSTSLGAEGIPYSGGETLLLADTPNQMLKAIRLLLSDAHLSNAIAARARDLVERRFSRETGHAALNNALHETMAARD